MNEDWTLGPLTRLVDLNHNGKPDLIRFYNGAYLQVAENTSQPETGIKFKARKPVKIADGGARPLAIFLVDLNGDGIPDLVVRYSNTLRVWYGKGNFEFESQPEYLGLWNARGSQPVFLDETVQVNFVDINQDGLPDLILTHSYGSQFFLNRSGSTNPDRRMIQMLFQVPQTESINGSMPSILDLSSSGNHQAVASVRGKILATDLSKAGAGLMKKYIDGKGSSLAFTYTRMQPEPGIGTRAPILSTILIQSSGTKPVKYDLSFVHARMHPKTRALMGFEDIQNKIKTVLDQTIEEKSLTYAL